MEHAESGEIDVRSLSRDGRVGIEVIARDHGQGITDVELAMRDGYSSSGGLGHGLPDARRIMDELEIESQPCVETTVTLR